LVLARYFLLPKPHVSTEEKQAAMAAGEKELAIAAAGLPGQVDIFNLRADLERQRGRWKEALRNCEKAVELDPRHPQTAENLVELYLDLRRYADAERLLDKMIATTPRQLTGLFWKHKCTIALAQGDAKAGMAALDTSPSRNLGLWSFNHALAYVFLLQRDYTKAEEILQTVDQMAKNRNLLPDGSNELNMRGIALEKLGRIARFRGETDKALSYFEAARQSFEQWLVKKTVKEPWPESHAQMYIAEIDAALGHKEDAIREGRDAVALWPPERDRGIASDLAAWLAVVYMWAGERDPALEQLAEAAKHPAPLAAEIVNGAGQSAGELKLNPLWDEVRNDPRFDKIIAEAAKPIKVD
jgi:tetratricopeptide (TPR) repeat protein